MCVTRGAGETGVGWGEADVPVEEGGDGVGVAGLGVEGEGVVQEEGGHGVFGSAGRVGAGTGGEERNGCGGVGLRA